MGREEHEGGRCVPREESQAVQLSPQDEKDHEGLESRLIRELGQHEEGKVAEGTW